MQQRLAELGLASAADVRLSTKERLQVRRCSRTRPSLSCACVRPAIVWSRVAGTCWEVCCQRACLPSFSNAT